MESLATALSIYADRLVVDRTGLTGFYDFTLTYDVAERVSDKPGLTMFDAVAEQLGLKVAEGKAPFDLVVVDRANKTPTEN